MTGSFSRFAAMEARRTHSVLERQPFIFKSLWSLYSVRALGLALFLAFSSAHLPPVPFPNAKC